MATYLFLLSPQTGIDIRYEEFFRSLGNKLYGTFGKEGVLMFMDERGVEYDTRLYLSKKTLLQKNGNYKSEIFPINTRRIGFVSTAFLISLIIATPLTWKRKFIALLLGFILITAYAMVKMRVLILHFYTLAKKTALYQSPEEIKSIEFWSDTFARPNTPVYYYVIIVWLAVCFGKKDWEKLNGTFAKITSKQSISRSYAKPDPHSAKEPVKSKKNKLHKHR